MIHVGRQICESFREQEDFFGLFRSYPLVPPKYALTPFRTDLIYGIALPITYGTIRATPYYYSIGTIGRRLIHRWRGVLCALRLA